MISWSEPQWTFHYLLFPVASANVTGMLHFKTHTGTHYDLKDVIENETSFLSLLNNHPIRIQVKGYSTTIATINRSTVEVMSEQYQERKVIIQKSQMVTFPA